MHPICVARFMRVSTVVAVSVAVLGAAPAAADPAVKPGEPVGGQISAMIEQFGQSLCPSLVKPGSDLAAKLSELQGNTGLTPALTGIIAGLAIQTQCPGVMTQIANGNVLLPPLKLPGR